MKRQILIGVDVDQWKHPDGHQGFDLEQMKANWTESTVRAIIQSLRSKAPVEHNGKTFRAFVIRTNLSVED